jgi:formate hydrogenlyase subunit 4
MAGSFIQKVILGLLIDGIHTQIRAVVKPRPSVPVAQAFRRETSVTAA